MVVFTEFLIRKENGYKMEDLTKAVNVQRAYTVPVVQGPPSMTGWKTKAGAALIALGGTISASAKLAPHAEAGPWLEFAGFIVAGFGGAFTVWGIGHKLEKNQTMVSINARTNAPIDTLNPQVVRK